MSIIIKGMAMPRKCQSCLLYKPYAGNGFCLMAGKRLIYNEVPSNPKGAGRFCPLVELPEKHGVLIDRDALIEDVRKNSESYFADDFARERVDRQPIIVEAEGE